MSDEKSAPVVVAGGGQAAVQFAASLRQNGYQGRIKLVSDEAYLPYQRPPLSKTYLKGTLLADRLLFRPRDWYEAEGIDVLLRRSVTEIDRVEKRVFLSGGERLPYSHLVLCIGARARPLPVPGVDLRGIYTLRSLADADRIQPVLKPGTKLSIIGGGYVGLEVAALCRSAGVDVTLLEAESRVLARVTSPAVSDFFTREHRGHGVDIRTSTIASGFESAGGAVTGVITGNRASLACDAVLVGTGILPNQELAERCGLSVSNGIIVDADARTSDPWIFAAGDCTTRPLQLHVGHRRLESVHNAIEQAKLAAAAISGMARPKLECPWFWSDQYDLKLQIAGLSAGYDALAVRGDPADRKFAVFYLKDRRLIAVDAINSPAEYLAAKRLIPEQASIETAALTNPTVNLREFCKT